jgi:hypothetical protein
LNAKVEAEAKKNVKLSETFTIFGINALALPPNALAD